MHPRPLLPLLALSLLAATAPSFHTQLTTAYLTCDWTTLDTLLKDQKQIAALPKDAAADLTAIKLALAETRPPWWNNVKTGKKTAFQTTLLGRNYGITFDPSLKSTVQLALNDGVPTYAVKWNADDMDSQDEGEFGFSKGDLTDLAIFATLGSVIAWGAIPPAEKEMTDAEKIALGYYLDFRGNAVAIAYANPGGRRWGNWLFLAAYKEMFAKIPARMGRKALGALFIHEILTHPEIYTSIPLPRELPAKDAEEILATFLADHLKQEPNKPWTLKEDNAFRMAAKGFANANGQRAYSTGLVTLPNKLTIALDAPADAPLQPKRDAWVKQQFDKLPKR
jgi:hypothetical protein